MFNEFYRKYRTAVIVLGALLLVNIAVFVFLTLPKINREADIRTRLENMRVEARSQQARLQEQENRLLAYQSQSQQLLAFYEETLGLRSGRMTQILDERQRIAQGSGVRPENVRYATSFVRDQPLEGFTMSFPLRGSYQALRSFLRTIEQSRQFFIIEGVELESAEAGGAALSMRISVSTYFYDPDAIRLQMSEAESEEEPS